MSRAQDIELAALRDGYPALAAWMARDPDKETLIFRKFDRLAARNCLHLQARLVSLEHEIDVLDEQARHSHNDEEALLSSMRWETMMKHAGNKSRPEAERKRKLDELQQLLREYYKMLLLHSQVANLQRPRDRPLKASREYLRGTAFKTKEQQAMPLIWGRAQTYLDDDVDLVALMNITDEDHLSRFLQDHWLFKKQRAGPDRQINRTTIYEKLHIVRTVAMLDLVLAAILLIGAIVNLYLVVDPSAKLGLVAMYTALFAKSVALCTNARRAEIFAATAAYAAVLVVFVSGDLGGTKTEQCLVQLEGGMFKAVACPG